MQNSQQLNQPPTEQSSVPKQKENLLLPILITFFISAVIFSLGGFYIGKEMSITSNSIVQENEPNEQVQPTATPTPILNTASSQTLRNLIDLLKNVEFRSIDRQTMWWVSDDNWSIIVDNSESIGLVRTEAFFELQDPTSVTTKIVDSVSSYFANQGFKQNLINSSTNVDDDTFYDFIRGFESKDEKCLLTVNPDDSRYEDENKLMVSFPNIVISCAGALSFEENYDKQIPFLRAMNDRKAVIYVREETDTAVKASVNWRRSGSFALFSKKNGYWEMIYRGQDQPRCQILEEYNFPKDIHESCY